MKSSLFTRFMGVIATLLVVCSCQHRPLVDMGNTHYVRVYVQPDIQNVTYGFYDPTLPKPRFRLPNVMRFMLCDPQTGHVVGERYLQNVGRDEKGYYVDGYVIAPAGSYRVMCYNFGTEATQIRHENNYYKVEAYTNRVSDMIATQFPQSKAEFEGQPILYDPDHLFVAQEELIEIPPTPNIDTLYAAKGGYFEARTLVKSYYIQLRIKGVQWVQSSVSLLSGMSPSVWVHNRELNEYDPSILFFELKAGHRSDRIYPQTNAENDFANENGIPNPNADANEPQTATLYTTFNTFGKLPNESSIFRITFEFVRIDGKSQTETMDITPLFRSKEALEHQWLLIDREIVIEKPEPEGGGGFEPGVDEWDDEHIDIIL